MQTDFVRSRTLGLCAILILGLAGLGLGAGIAAAADFEPPQQSRFPGRSASDGAGHQLAESNYLCMQRCKAQYDTCNRGCDYIADKTRQWSCIMGCANGRNSCEARCQ